MHNVELEEMSLNSCELTYFISTLALAIAQNLSNTELALIGAVLDQMGDTFETILAQRQFCSQSTSPANTTTNSNGASPLPF